MPNGKRCTGCGQEKALDEFNRNRTAPDGRQFRCRLCDRAASRIWRQANREKLIAAVRRSQLRHPEKRKARTAVHNAVRDGRLNKPEHCEVCGQRVSRNDLHAHHDDYSKPLEVRWFCRECHVSEHRETHHVA